MELYDFIDFKNLLCRVVSFFVREESVHLLIEFHRVVPFLQKLSDFHSARMTWRQT